MIGNAFFLSAKLIWSAGGGRTSYPTLHEPNLMRERGERRILGKYFLLSTKLFGCVGRSEENWCYAVDSNC